MPPKPISLYDQETIDRMFAERDARLKAIEEKLSVTPPPPPPSDVLSHGKPFTLVGPGFGTKPISSPRAYSTFFGGTVDQPVNEGRIGVYPTSAVAPRYSTTRLRGVNTRSCRVELKHWPVVTAGSALQVDLGLATQGFLSYYMFLDRWTSRAGSKILQILSNTAAQDKRSLIYQGGVLTSNQSPGVVSYPTKPYDQCYLAPEGIYSNYTGVWVHLFSIFRMDTAVDAGDGIWQVWLNGVLPRTDQGGSQLVMHAYNQFRIRRSAGSHGDATAWTKLLLGVQNDSTDTTMDHYIDSLYVETGTLARVILADRPVLDDCRHIELQPPLFWEDGKIECLCQQGTFPAGSEVFAYVIKDNGQSWQLAGVSRRFQ